MTGVGLWSKNSFFREIQRETISLLRFVGYLLRFHLASDWSRNINIPEIFFSVHGFMGKTVRVPI